MSKTAFDRLMIFIDGQNLIYACQNFAFQKGKNQKFHYVEEDLETYLINLQKGRRHIQTRFYTAILEPDPERGEKDIERYERQLKRNKTLRTNLKWEVYYKEIKSHPFLCPHCYWKGNEYQVVCGSCGEKIKNVRNKGVDVALATDVLLYGLTDAYDVAILVSGDNDFVPVVKKLKDRKPQLRVEIAQFENAVGYEMRETADKFYPFDKDYTKIGKLF